MKIIAFSNQKGGVGKTTACVNVATYLAESGKRVLVVDMDAQANATSSLGIFDKKAQNSSYDALLGGKNTEACIRQTEVDGLKILPASNDLAGAELELCRIENGREKMLLRCLEDVCEDFDYVMIDCPPSLSLVTVNALCAANYVVIPLVAEFFALEGLSQMMNTIRLVKRHLNPSLQIGGILFSSYDGRSKLARDVRAEVQRLFGDKVFETTIPKNVRLAEAPSFGKPILLYDKKCAGALAYASLSQEFIQKIN